MRADWRQCAAQVDKVIGPWGWGHVPHGITGDYRLLLIISK